MARRDAQLSDFGGALRRDAVRGVRDVGHAALVNQLLDEADHAEVVTAKLSALEHALGARGERERERDAARGVV